MFMELQVVNRVTRAVNTRQRRRTMQKKGFTLIELLVVIAIM